MKWHYDVTQAEMILRDVPFYSNSTDYVKGIPLQKEVITTEVNQMFCLPAAATTVDNIVGVTVEAYDFSEHKSGPCKQGDNGISAVATGFTNYLKTCINPFAVYLAEISQLAADDTALTAADATGKSVTVGVFTTDRQGDWIYITNLGSAIGGAGNLFQIGADAAGTTVATAVTLYDDFLKGNIIGDTAIWAYNMYSALAASGSIDLAANLANIKSPGVAGTGALMCLQSYITDKGNPMAPLRETRHSGRNFDAASAHLYSDVLFTDHIMGMNVRIIT